MRLDISNAVKIVDVDSVISQEIEPLVQEDNYKFCLETKEKLLRKFIVYRVCNFVIKTIESNRNSGAKILFYTNKKAALTFLKPYDLFIYNIFIKLSKILSISLYMNNLPVKKFTELLHSSSGEGREARARINFIFNRSLKRPNLLKFKKLLNAYDIHKIDGDMDNGFKVKIGLFVT